MARSYAGGVPLRKLVELPHREDVESPLRTESTRMLWTVIRTTMASATGFLLLVAVVQPTQAPRALSAAALVLLLGLVAIGLTRAGRLRGGAWVLVWGLVGTVTLMALSAGGIRSVGVGAYLVFVLMAGLLLGERSGWLVGIVCVLLGLGLVLGERFGVVSPRGADYTPLARLLLISLYIGLVIALQRLATRAVRQALARAASEIDVRRAAEQHLSLALEAGGIGVWHREVGSGELHGDARVAALHGREPAEAFRIPFEEWRDLVHPEDRAKLDQLANPPSPGRDLSRVEFRIIRPDGSERIVDSAALTLRDEAGRPTRVVGMNIDVTERRAAELERDRLVRDLGERVKELQLLHAAARLLQRAPSADASLLQELVALMPRAWQYPETCVARIVFRDIDVRSPGWRASPRALSAEFSCTSGQGRIEVAYLEERPLADEGPFLAEERALLTSLVELLVAHLERGAADERRRHTEHQLRQSQKMEALGTLAGGIAHDFNNILAAIHGNARLAREHLTEVHPAREHVDEIGRAGARAADLVRSILAFSRKQETSRHVVRVRPIVEEVHRLLRATLPPNVTIRTTHSEGLPPVLADASQLHQVLMNLGTNAGHAMRDGGGTLRIALDVVEVADPLSAPSPELRPGTHLRISVQDEGTGMSPEIVQRVFEPFFTTKGTGGTGLGLAVVLGIIQEHDGAITVASEVGVGTRFEVFLPAAEGEPPSADPRHRVLPGRGERIAYVDDEEAVVFVMTRMLRRLGYETTGFSDPHLALQTFRSDPGAFDAIVTDRAMPGMDGLTLAREIGRIRPGVPVALSSGIREDADRAAAAGISVVLTKPITLEDLSAALRRILDARAPTGG